MALADIAKQKKASGALAAIAAQKHVIQGEHTGPSSYTSDTHKMLGAPHKTTQAPSFNDTKDYRKVTGKNPPMASVKWK